MKKQNLRPRIAMAALALGAMIVAGPAFAQRSPNDGGQISAVAQPGVAASKSKTAAQKPATPQLGRNVNDGGLPAEPNAAQLNATKSSAKVATQPGAAHLGRNVNDGGLVDNQ